MHKVGIVGCGIAGLSHAYLLTKAGAKVTMYDRDAFATGASVRNFGMIWPVGQSPAIHPLALKSRDYWLEAAGEAGFVAKTTGSIHAVHHPLEMQVLREFAKGNADVELMSSSEVLKRCPLIRADGLEGGMYSSSEVCVDPREVVHLLAAYLERQGVEFKWKTPVVKVRSNEVTLASGQVEQFDHVIAALGPWLSDTDSERWRHAGLKRCRLQMMRFRPLTEARVGTHLAFGLTLGHYANFAVCPSLSELRTFHESRWPNQAKFGIHILISEHSDGTITVGDSHEYGDTLMPYRRDEVDAAIMDAAQTYFQLEKYQLAERWEGFYPTHPNLPFYLEHEPGLTAVNLFGTGMTLSFGVAELTMKHLL